MQAIARLGKINARRAEAAEAAQVDDVVDDPAGAIEYESDSEEDVGPDGKRKKRVARNGEARELLSCICRGPTFDLTADKKYTRAHLVKTAAFASLENGVQAFENEQRQFNEETREHRLRKLELMRETADREDRRAREAIMRQDARSAQNLLLETAKWMAVKNPGKSMQEIQAEALEWVQYAENARGVQN
jgi:hypothetical protein